MRDFHELALVLVTPIMKILHTFNRIHKKWQKVALSRNCRELLRQKRAWTMGGHGRMLQVACIHAGQEAYTSLALWWISPGRLEPCVAGCRPGPGPARASAAQPAAHVRTLSATLLCLARRGPATRNRASSLDYSRPGPAPRGRSGRWSPRALGERAGHSPRASLSPIPCLAAGRVAG